MSKKIQLLINLYPINDAARQAEIADCLKRNIANPFISEIIVLDEGFQKKELLDYPKVKVHPISGRPTFTDFYDHLSPIRFNLMSNNDIWFDRSLGRIRWLLLNRYDLLGLTRTEPDGALYRGATGDSQDSWLFYGKAAPLKECTFSMGMPGCENRLAFLFFRKRYRVLNPSRLIKARHAHLSNSRSYQTVDRIPGDYLSTRPVGLLRFHFFRLILKILQHSKILVVKDIQSTSNTKLT